MKGIITLCLLLPAIAFAAPIDDAKTVLNTLAGKTLTNAELLRIADAFIWTARSAVMPTEVVNVDGEDITQRVPIDLLSNTQKAQIILDSMENRVRRLVRAYGKSTRTGAADATRDADLEAGADAAEADLN